MNWGSYTPIPQEVEQAATTCVDCGMTVHRILGPGFKEPIYEEAFRLELHSRGVAFEAAKAIAVRYKSWEIPGQRIDLLIAGILVVEIGNEREHAATRQRAERVTHVLEERVHEPGLERVTALRDAQQAGFHP